MRRDLINQSAGSGGEGGLFCISSVCFFLGFFLPWQEVPRAYQQLKEELHSFSGDSSIPPFVQGQCLFERPSSGGAGPADRTSHKPATSLPAANLNIWDLISIRYRWASGATCLSLRSDSVHVRPVSMWAILLAFHNYPFYVVALRVKVQWKRPVFHVSGNLIEAVCLKKRSLLVKSHSVLRSAWLTPLHPPTAPNFLKERSQTFQPMVYPPSSASSLELKDKFGPGSFFPGSSICLVSGLRK